METTFRTLLIFFISIFCLHTTTFSQTKVYEGSINGKYKIEMHLNFVKNSIYGYYVYKSKGVPIAVFGETKGTKIKIIESDLIDTAVFFQGDISGLQITGDWQDKYKKSKMPFSVTQLQKTDAPKHFFIKDGSYEYITDKSFKYCSVYYIDNNLFYFECSVGTENCDGQIFGMAKIDALGKAQSLKMANLHSECFLKFAFGKSKVKIEEGGECFSNHGASCTFGGVFISP